MDALVRLCGRYLQQYGSGRASPQANGTALPIGRRRPHMRSGILKDTTS